MRREHAKTLRFGNMGGQILCLWVLRKMAWQFITIVQGVMASGRLTLHFFLPFQKGFIHE